MSDFFSSFWTLFISAGTLGGIFWMVYLLIINNKVKAPSDGETVKSTGHEWDGIEELNNPLPFWWVAMFYITIVFGLLYLVLYPGLGTAKGILGWTSTGAHTQEVADADAKYGPLFEEYASIPIEQLATNEEARRTGGRLFANNCAVCHGSDGRGARGFPNLADNDWLYGGNASDIKTTLMQGRKAAMPAWSQVLDADGITNVTSYVLSLSGRDVPADQVAAGKPLFDSLCAGCHMASGEGMSALGAPNLTDDIWLYGGTRGIIEETLVSGRNGVMPAFHELLGEDKVHVLAAYVYGLGKTQAN